MPKDAPNPAAGTSGTPQVDAVCFGLVTPATLVVVDKFPRVNIGAVWQHVTEFISEDAAIVAILLHSWGVRSGLISSTPGNDTRGRRTVRRLRDLGIAGRFRTSSRVSTPVEINISDADGHRTYFWRRDPAVLATLDTADLSLLTGARLLYVDWYDGPHILRPMRQAAGQRTPVFLNFEHGHHDAQILALYAPLAAICQAVTDDAQSATTIVRWPRPSLTLESDWPS